jgi:DNA-binding SARP family transcriptional activator
MRGRVAEVSGATEFRLLGTVEADRGGIPVDQGRRRERCLLGLLLLEAGHLVQVERLLDLLWDDDAPPKARASLHTHVSRLRAKLDPDGTGVRLLAKDTAIWPTSTRTVSTSTGSGRWSRRPGS